MDLYLLIENEPYEGGAIAGVFLTLGLAMHAGEKKANNSFRLKDDGSAWVAKRGRVNYYIVKTRANEPGEELDECNYLY